MENHPLPQSLQDLTRRHFFGRCAMGLGNLALASMLAEGQTGPTSTPAASESLKTPATHHPARAKSIIYLFMAGVEVGPGVGSVCPSASIEASARLPKPMAQRPKKCLRVRSCSD